MEGTGGMEGDGGERRKMQGLEAGRGWREIEGEKKGKRREKGNGPCLACLNKT